MFSIDLAGPRSYRAISKDDYMGDLVKSEPKQISKQELTQNASQKIGIKASMLYCVYQPEIMRSYGKHKLAT